MNPQQANAIQPGGNQQISPGTLILNQGSEPNRLIILHSGTLTFRACPQDNEAPNLANSKYILSMQAPAIIGANMLILNEPAAYFAAAESACVVSVYPAGFSNVLKIIQGKPKIAILMLRSMVRQCQEAYKKLNEAEQLIEHLANTTQALSLAYSRIMPDQFTSEGNFTDPVVQAAREVVAKYGRLGLTIPDDIELPFLQGEHTEMLGMDYEHNSSIEFEDLDYLESFSMLDAPIVGAIAQKNPKFILQTARKLANQFIAILDEIMQTSLTVQKYGNEIFRGEYSWIEKMAIRAELAQSKNSADRNLLNTAHFFINEARRIMDEYQRLWTLNDYSIDNQSFRKIEQFVTVMEKAAMNELKQQMQHAEASISQAQVGKGPGVSVLANSAQQILDYAQIDAEKRTEFTQLLKTLKEFANPLDSEGDPRKARRHITPIYWHLFEKCFLNYIADPHNLPRPVELMFLTGFVDEGFLTPDQLNFISGIHREKSQYPIHDTIDWLTMIYQKQVPTSVNDLGLTFFEVIRQENKDANWKRETDLPANVNTGEARLRFEINNSFSATTKLASGSIMTHLPILTQFHFTQAPERSLLGKKTLEEQINKLLAVDFGAFHREVLYDNDDIGIKREFIQVQVIPNFILVPTVGGNIQFWEEREGNNRTSRGRLMAPYLITDDPYDMLIHSTGAYRWEMVKTTLGPDWNNITSASITADYTDYVQFYKKNRDLSPEVKEKLAAEFKRFRDDRSRFINDYMIWCKFESEGIQKLNKVARKIMARHIPFTTPIRENLLKQPNFQDVITKATNLRKRKAIELEPRYKKYRNSNGGVLPQELENTLKFYNMDFS